MSIYDRNLTSGVNDLGHADSIVQHLTRSVSMIQAAVKRTQRLIDNAPGGKAAIITALGAEDQQAVDVLEALTTLFNTHKDPALNALTSPLVQGDLL